METMGTEQVTCLYIFLAVYLCFPSFNWYAYSKNIFVMIRSTNMFGSTVLKKTLRLKCTICQSVGDFGRCSQMQWLFSGMLPGWESASIEPNFLLPSCTWSLLDVVQPCLAFSISVFAAPTIVVGEQPSRFIYSRCQVQILAILKGFPGVPHFIQSNARTWPEIDTSAFSLIRSWLIIWSFEPCYTVQCELWTVLINKLQVNK